MQLESDPPRWKWYSKTEIDSAQTDLKGLSDAEIIRCIDLFRNTAKVHSEDDFDLSKHTYEEYVGKLKKSADGGWLVMALQPAGGAHTANTLFFQKSRGITDHYGRTAWVVSLGLDESNYPSDDVEPAATRGYIRTYLNSALDLFIDAMPNDRLYIVDPESLKTPVTRPLRSARPIAKIDFYGRYRSNVVDGNAGDANRSDWEKETVDEQGERFTGQDGFHEHWGGKFGKSMNGPWEFRSMRIKRRH